MRSGGVGGRSAALRLNSSGQWHRHVEAGPRARECIGAIFLPPTPLALALDQVAAWLESPSLVVLGEARGYWDAFQAVTLGGRVTGPLAHDARVAALCVHHGVDELWTVDRDSGRFPALTVRNPLAG